MVFQLQIAKDRAAVPPHPRLSIRGGRALIWGYHLKDTKSPCKHNGYRALKRKVFTAKIDPAGRNDVQLRSESLLAHTEEREVPTCDWLTTEPTSTAVPTAAAK